MEAGTTEQCLNATDGAVREGMRNRGPAAHSPQDTHFLSGKTAQHREGAGG